MCGLHRSSPGPVQVQTSWPERMTSKPTNIGETSAMKGDWDSKTDLRALSMQLGVRMRQGGL